MTRVCTWVTSTRLSRSVKLSVFLSDTELHLWAGSFGNTETRVLGALTTLRRFFLLPSGSQAFSHVWFTVWRPEALSGSPQSSTANKQQCKGPQPHSTLCLTGNSNLQVTADFPIPHSEYFTATQFLADRKITTPQHTIHIYNTHTLHNIHTTHTWHHTTPHKVYMMHLELSSADIASCAQQECIEEMEINMTFYHSKHKSRQFSVRKLSKHCRAIVIHIETFTDFCNSQCLANCPTAIGTIRNSNSHTNNRFSTEGYKKTPIPITLWNGYFRLLCGEAKTVKFCSSWR